VQYEEIAIQLREYIDTASCSSCKLGVIEYTPTCLGSQKDSIHRNELKDGSQGFHPETYPM
jgi:hypothetical protein